MPRPVSDTRRSRRGVRRDRRHHDPATAGCRVGMRGLYTDVRPHSARELTERDEQVQPRLADDPRRRRQRYRRPVPAAARRSARRGRRHPHRDVGDREDLCGLLRRQPRVGDIYRGPCWRPPPRRYAARTERRALPRSVAAEPSPTPLRAGAPAIRRLGVEHRHRHGDEAAPRARRLNTSATVETVRTGSAAAVRSSRSPGTQSRQLSRTIRSADSIRAVMSWISVALAVGVVGLVGASSTRCSAICDSTAVS